jgi:hypothetical protein
MSGEGSPDGSAAGAGRHAPQDRKRFAIRGSPLGAANREPGPRPCRDYFTFTFEKNSPSCGGGCWEE